MTLTSRFNINDIVWRMENNKPIKIPVISISFPHITDPVEDQENNNRFRYNGIHEGEIFATKEELLASL